MAVASWMVQLTALVVPPGTPRVGEISVHLPVLLAMTVASAAIGAFVGSVAAWHSTRIDQAGAFTRSEAGATARSGFRRLGPRTLVVVTEIAMTVVLCVGAGLLIRGFVALVNVNPGYDVRNVMMFQIVLPAAHAPDPGRLWSCQDLVETVSTWRMSRFELLGPRICMPARRMRGPWCLDHERAAQRQFWRRLPAAAFCASQPLQLTTVSITDCVNKRANFGFSKIEGRRHMHCVSVSSDQGACFTVLSKWLST